jgi:hypothetical protein
VSCFADRSSVCVQASELCGSDIIWWHQPQKMCLCVLCVFADDVEVAHVILLGLHSRGCSLVRTVAVLLLSEVPLRSTQAKMAPVLHSRGTIGFLY